MFQMQLLSVNNKLIKTDVRGTYTKKIQSRHISWAKMSIVYIGLQLIEKSHLFHQAFENKMTAPLLWVFFNWYL